MPPVTLLLLWSVWVLQAVISAIQVRKTARLFDRYDRHRHDAFRPPVTVIVPFKGIDTDFDAHARSLFEQDYPDYELLLVVDSKNDPCYPLLAQQIEKHPQRKAEILVAGPTGPHEGQKIHNQLFAIDHLETRDAITEEESWVWVFADSDAAPGPRWLADLVGPLGRHTSIGLTTGYRWLIPTSPGSTNTTQPNRSTIWSALASIMNSSVACFHKNDRLNYAWGGSMALRAQTARRGRLRDRLVGALCDDFQFSRLCRDLGLRIYYVPWCLVATRVDLTAASLINFAHRQYLLTRVYAPLIYWAGLAIATLYVAGFLAVWAALVASLAGYSSWGSWHWPAGVIAAVFLANQIRSSYRRKVIEKAFGSECLDELKTALYLDRWATPVWMILHWLLILRAAFGRTMNWRGIRYRLGAPQQVERLN